MKKEEILRKSREEKNDEGVTYEKNEGLRFGVIGFCTIFVIIMVFNIIMKQNNFVPYSMFFGFMACEALGKYRFKKTNAYLFTIILASVASILFLACYILTVLGIGA